MTKSLLIIFLLITSTISYVGSNESVFIDVRKDIKILNKGIDSKTITTLQESKLDGEFNYSYNEIFEFISKLKTEYGGLKPREEGVDAFINSTYWAILSLKIIGRLDKYIVLNEDLKDFFDYLYNEETGGFRGYLEDKENLVSTGYALLAMNISKTKPTNYNGTITIEYIRTELNKTETTTDLLSLVMAGISLVVLGEADEAKGLKSDIMNFYNEGSFYDPDSNLPKLLQTYLTILYLKLLGEDLSTIKDEIIDFILSTQIILGNDTVAFGEEFKPSLFHTGLATFLLSELSYNLSDVAYNVTKFVFSLYSEGGFKENENATVPDVFSTAGALLALFSLKFIYKDFDIKANFAVGDQIPVDLNFTKLKVIVKLEGELIDWLVVWNNLTNEYSEFSKAEGGYSWYVNITELGFGRYTVSFHYWPNLFFLSNISNSFSKKFRVGYNISVLINTTNLKPGEIVQFNVSITFYNGSYVKNGSLIYEIKYSNSVLYNGTIPLNGTPLLVNFTLSNNSSLGTYMASFLVNDSNGFNHTYAALTFRVDDIINVFSIDGNKSMYHIGEIISVNSSLVFNSTGAYVSNVNITPVLKGWDKEEIGNATWINSTTFNVEIVVPPKLLTENTAKIILVISWPTQYKMNLSLMKFDLNITSIDLDIVAGETLYIGETANLQIRVYSNVTDVELENVSITGFIEDNYTYQKLSLNYDKSTKLYITNETIDPDIPEGEYSLNVTIPYPIKNTTIKLVVHNKVKVKGIPVIDEDTFTITPAEPFVGDTIQIEFKVRSVADNETRVFLTDLTLKSNITRDNETTVAAVNEVNGNYTLAFKLQFEGEYKIVIYRESDELILKTLNIYVKRKKPSIYEILEPYVIGSLWLSSLVLIGIYLFARNYFGKRISKRYLIRKARKRK